MVAPRLALKTLEAAGFPDVWFAMLSHVWLDQHRWLQLGQNFLPQASIVSESLPQGDAFPPLTLNVLLSSPVRDVAMQEQHTNFAQAVSLDDRTYVAVNPSQGRRVFLTWEWWSKVLGLRENMSKLKIIPRQKAQHAELLQVGFPLQTLTSQARVLGIDFCDHLNIASRSTANKRVQAAELQARRLCKTKAVPLQAKKILWRTRIVPKAAWGCFFHMPKMTSLQAAYRKFMYVHTLGSPDLRCILDGHTSDLHFMAGSLVANALRKMAISGRVPWYERPKCGTWLHTVQMWLSKFGWWVAGPWKWCHDACRLSMDWMELLDMPNQERFKFLLDKFDHGGLRIFLLG